jgi:hypothetical protein
MNVGPFSGTNPSAKQDDGLGPSQSQARMLPISPLSARPEHPELLQPAADPPTRVHRLARKPPALRLVRTDETVPAHELGERLGMAQRNSNSSSPPKSAPTNSSSTCWSKGDRSTATRRSLPANSSFAPFVTRLYSCGWVALNRSDLGDLVVCFASIGLDRVSSVSVARDPEPARQSNRLRTGYMTRKRRSQREWPLQRLMPRGGPHPRRQA